MEKYKSIADDLKSKSDGLDAQVLTLKKVSNPLIKSRVYIYYNIIYSLMYLMVFLCFCIRGVSLHNIETGFPNTIMMIAQSSLVTIALEDCHYYN